ncbi:MAG TPA: MFS transporter [Candidatus Saccharimonadales bacterium]|nr:MFS transporter [Candidatus Saccharimonadales bacterium]
MVKKVSKKAADGLKDYGLRSFSSLSVRNYRLYFGGQAISLSGTWLDTVAQAWLILELTHSGTLLGLLAAARFLPVLILGPYGGLIADSVNKRRLLYVTQTGAMILAFILAAIVVTNTVQVWMVFVLASCLGLINAVDSPTRQTFVMEMVGKEKLTNAISLNSIEVNIARIIGPVIAAALIAGVGLGWCFFINGLSYIAVLICLKLMDGSELLPSLPSARGKGRLRAGFFYVWHTPVLRNVLIIMALVGALSYEFQVVLPLFATQTFGGNAGTYALMMTAMGLGSLIGGLFTASRGNPSPKRLLEATIALGISMILTAITPDLPMALAALVLVGFCTISFTALTNTTLQLNSVQDMRGRVMALWVMAFLGSTPIGGPIIGYISEHGSPRLGLAVGGLAALLSAVFGILALRNYRKKQSIPL